jgi:hypothetical protein
MPAITFIMDARLLEDTGHQHLPDALRELGHTVHLEVYQDPRALTPAFIDTHDECTVLYGSIEFVEQRMDAGAYSPGAYYSRESYRCTYYLPTLPNELVGNGRGVYLTFSDFVKRREQIYRLFGVSRLFIRPDSGAKVFTGLCITPENAGFELQSLMKLTQVTDETLILVAPAAEISAEYRFYIVEGKVITGSRYMVEGKPDQSPETDPQCRAVAELVAQLPWQIDLAYTCDVGLFDGIAKIVELNAFSTSGLYRCDSVALFTAVAETALQEFDGEVSLMSKPLTIID